MTTKQLEIANELIKEIKDVKSIIDSLRAETDREIGFTQTLPQQNIQNINLEVIAEEQKEYRKSLRVVLEATKQTILSIYERELQRLEKEFQNI